MMTVINKDSKAGIKRLCVDMDGTLAVFKPVNTMEVLYEKNYFSSLIPQKNVIEAIRQLGITHSEVEIYILSSVLSDSLYALQEKQEWLDTYLPEIDKKHRLFCSCGESKLLYAQKMLGNITQNDFLLDDYSKNLLSWSPPGRGIKLLNGINHTNQTWKGERVSVKRTAKSLSEAIYQCLTGKKIEDKKPSMESLVRESVEI